MIATLLIIAMLLMAFKRDLNKIDYVIALLVFMALYKIIW